MKNLFYYVRYENNAYLILKSKRKIKNIYKKQSIVAERGICTIIKDHEPVCLPLKFKDSV